MSCSATLSVALEKDLIVSCPIYIPPTRLPETRDILDRVDDPLSPATVIRSTWVQMSTSITCASISKVTEHRCRNLGEVLLVGILASTRDESAENMIRTLLSRPAAPSADETVDAIREVEASTSFWAATASLTSVRDNVTQALLIAMRSDRTLMREVGGCKSLFLTMGDYKGAHLLNDSECSDRGMTNIIGRAILNAGSQWRQSKSERLATHVEVWMAKQKKNGALAYSALHLKIYTLPAGDGGVDHGVFISMSGEILLADMTTMERLTTHIGSGAEGDDVNRRSTRQLVSPYEAGDLLVSSQLACTVCGLAVEKPFTTVKFVEVGHRPCLDAANLQRGMELVTSSMTDLADELLLPTVMSYQEVSAGQGSHLTDRIIMPMDPDESGLLTLCSSVLENSGARSGQTKFLSLEHLRGTGSFHLMDLLGTVKRLKVRSDGKAFGAILLEMRDVAYLLVLGVKQPSRNSKGALTAELIAQADGYGLCRLVGFHWTQSEVAEARVFTERMRRGSAGAKAFSLERAPPTYTTGSDAVDTELSEQQEEAESHGKGYQGPSVDDLKRMVEEVVESKMGKALSKVKDELVAIMSKSASGSEARPKESLDRGVLGFYTGDAMDLIQRAEASLSGKSRSGG